MGALNGDILFLWLIQSDRTSEFEPTRDSGDTSEANLGLLSRAEPSVNLSLIDMRRFQNVSQ